MQTSESESKNSTSANHASRRGFTPVSNVVSQHRSASFCHLANIAMRLERKLHWDPKKETFANDDEANSMVSRQQREGYRIDVDV